MPLIVKLTITWTLRGGEDTMGKYPSKNSLASDGEGFFADQLSTYFRDLL